MRKLKVQSGSDAGSAQTDTKNAAPKLDAQDGKNSTVISTTDPTDSTTNPKDLKVGDQKCGDDSHHTEADTATHGATAPQTKETKCCVGVDSSVVDYILDGTVIVPPDPYDPFKPTNLKLNPENAGAAVKKVITAIRCGKPGKQDFARVRPGDEWRLDTMMMEEQDGGDSYLIVPALHDDLAHEGFPVRLVLAMTRSNNLLLWRLKLPRADGQSNHWNDAALAASKLAESKWIRLTSNMTAKCYDVFEATGINVEPQWPDLTFAEILRLCFKDRLIDSLDHPFLRRLRGEV